jgi:hypothetical protein
VSVTHEEVLSGGVANAGVVRRVGNVVLLQVSTAVIRRRVSEGTFPVPAVQFGGKT